MSGSIISSRWDVIVIGAGPAGSLAALQLARAGRQVLQVEKKTFPRFKVCGCCLNPNAIAGLKRVGLDSILAETNAVSVRDFELRVGSRTMSVPLPGGAILSRAAMDDAFVRVGQSAGVTFVDAVAARVVPVEDATPRLREVTLTSDTGEERVVSAQQIIAADGLSGSSLKRCAEFSTEISRSSYLGVCTHLSSADSKLEPGRIHMASAAEGYVGSVVLENGDLNYAAAISPQSVQQAHEPGQVVEKILASVGTPLPASPEPIRWVGTPLLTRRLNRVADRRILVIGDATGYVEPFTGEGMAWAIEMGIRVAEVILSNQTEHDSIEHDWTETVQQLRRERQFWCKQLTSLLRRPRLASLGMILGRLFRSVPPWIVGKMYEPSNRA